MADMIEAKDAKKILECDDATLNNYVNNGSIRAQRNAGKLLLNKEDVEKLAKDKEEDGTIVLTGDSDDLSIDLGKVVDDSADTIVQNKGGTGTESAGTDSITFGDELEVVSFDDKTSELVFDDTKPTTQQQGNLSFTDSNTAVMTAVDETSVGATTAPIEYQTGADERVSRGERPGTGRRSARSARVVAEEKPVHWIWPSLMVLTLVAGLFFILPYYVIAMWPWGTGDQRHAKSGDLRRGLDDNAWTNMASSIAGFTVEPSKAKFDKTHNGEEWVSMKEQADPQGGIFRSQQYLNGKDAVTRQKDFVIIKVDEEGKKASSETGVDYSIRESNSTVQGSDQPIKETYPDVWPK